MRHHLFHGPLALPGALAQLLGAEPPRDLAHARRRRAELRDQGADRERQPRLAALRREGERLPRGVDLLEVLGVVRRHRARVALDRERAAARAHALPAPARVVEPAEELDRLPPGLGEDLEQRREVGRVARLAPPRVERGPRLGDDAPQARHEGVAVALDEVADDLRDGPLAGRR